MNNKILLIALLLAVGLGRFSEMTREKMGELKKQKKNYLFHLVFINEQYISPFEQFLNENFIPNLVLYRTDCETTKFPECSNKKSYPLFLLFNKVIMHFPGNATNFQNIFQWINNTVFKNPISNIQSKAQLQKIIQEKRQIFIMLESSKTEGEKLVLMTLSKQYPFATFVYLTNQTIGQELSLKEGAFCQMTSNPNNSVCLAGSANFDKISSFVLEKFISFLPRANSLVNKRFLNQTVNIKTYIFGCDFSFACLKIWGYLLEAEPQLQGIQLKKIILGSKENDLFEAYFHMKVNKYRNPILIHVSQTNTNSEIGMPKRYLREFNHSSFSIEQIKRFVQNIENNEVQEVVLSEGALKKNGFSGKGGQKNIQKLSYESYKKQIEESEEGFVVLINRSDPECTNCEKLYRDYKKSITYLISEGVNFRYGVIDIDKNQVDIPELRRVPQILFYGGREKKGIRIKNLSFSGLTKALQEKYMQEKDSDL